MNYKIKHILNTIFLFTFCFLAFVVTATAQTYPTVVNIGTLGGQTSAAIDLNNNGYVIGNSENAQQDKRGFVYKISGGTTTAISTFGGYESFVNAINISNKVVGKAENADGDLHAFLYDIATDTLTDLHAAVSFGGLQSSAIGINDNGLIVGWAELADGNARGFIYNPATGAKTELGTFGGAISVAFDINNNNIVVGMAQVSDTVTHAFSYDIAAGVLTDLGTLGGNDINVSLINNSNQFIGTSTTDATTENTRGFRSSTTAINPATDTIPTLGGTNSIAFGLNDAGEVVGQADRTDGFGKAFLFSNNTTKNLNTIIPSNSGWDLWQATAINNSGQIVGNGLYQGQSRAFLLIPLAPTAASVTVSGRVQTSTGSGIANIFITLTSPSGNVRTARSSAFGYYRFADVAAGETYIITAFGKRFTFNQPSQVLNVNGDLTDINFIGHSQRSIARLNATNSSPQNQNTLFDFDGDGKTDISVFRPSNGAWYRLNSSDGSFFGVAFGQNGYVPTAADYDGDGKADIAVFRPADGAWYRLNSTNGGFFGQLFGFSTDKPIPAAFK